MIYANANKLHRKSGGAQWRDLLFPLSSQTNLSSRPKRSAVEDLRFPLFVPNKFVIPTEA
jgi:hypothetical protein